MLIAGLCSLRTFVVAALIGCSFFAATGSANEFSWQITGTEKYTELENSFETRRAFIDATYYLSPVTDANGPYALAAFLDPKTRVSASVSNERSEPQQFYGLVGGSVLRAETVSRMDNYSLGGRYVSAKSQWYAGGSASKTYPAGSSSLTGSRHPVQAYGVLAGKYFGANTSLELALNSSKQSDEIQYACVSFYCPVMPYTVTRTLETNDLSLDAFHVRRFRALTYSVSGRVSESNADTSTGVPVQLAGTFPGTPATMPPFAGGVAVTWRDRDLDPVRTYSIAGELFLTNRLGVRIGYTRWDGDSIVEDDSADLTSTWFVNRRIALQFGLSRQTYEVDLEHPETVSVRVLGRL